MPGGHLSEGAWQWTSQHDTSADGGPRCNFPIPNTGQLPGGGVEYVGLVVCTGLQPCAPRRAPGEVPHQAHHADHHLPDPPAAVLPVLLPDPHAGRQRAGRLHADGVEGDLGAGPPGPGGGGSGRAGGVCRRR